MAAGEPPDVEPINGVDNWNRIHWQARRNQPWDAVWADLHAIRRGLHKVLSGMSQAQMDTRYPFAWGGTGTSYDWLRDRAASSPYPKPRRGS